MDGARPGVNPAAKHLLRHSGTLPLVVDAVLFDMDGVLVDVAGSYHKAIADTVYTLAGIEVGRNQIQAYKNRGGYNDDWRLTEALLRDAGVPQPFERIVEVFNRLYRGQNWDGLIAEEPPLVTRETLAVLADSFALALVTGRPEAEARWTLSRFDWEPYFPVVVSMEMQAGRGKPDPFPLQLALELLALDRSGPIAPQRTVYVGDTVDDIRASVAMGGYAVGVIPQGVDVESVAPLFDELGAAAVVDDVNVLPHLVERPAANPDPAIRPPER